MPHKSETPHDGGASRNGCGGSFREPSTTVGLSTQAFTNHRTAARALLSVETLSEKEGQFCGGLSYRSAPLSERQANWLRILLSRHDLPDWFDGGACD